MNEKTFTNLECFILSHGCEYRLVKLMDIQALEITLFEKE